MWCLNTLSIICLVEKIFDYSLGSANIWLIFLSSRFKNTKFNTLVFIGCNLHHDMLLTEPLIDELTMKIIISCSSGLRQHEVKTNERLKGLIQNVVLVCWCVKSRRTVKLICTLCSHRSSAFFSTGRQVPWQPDSPPLHMKTTYFI